MVTRTELCKGRWHYGWARAFDLVKEGSAKEIGPKPKTSLPLTLGATDVSHRHICWQLQKPQTETLSAAIQAFSEGQSGHQLTRHSLHSVRRAPSMLHAPNMLNSQISWDPRGSIDRPIST